MYSMGVAIHMSSLASQGLTRETNTCQGRSHEITSGQVVDQHRMCICYGQRNAQKFWIFRLSESVSGTFLGQK